MKLRIRYLIAAALASAATPAAAQAATAPAQVFWPNPVQSLENETLTDQKDADFFSADPILSKAYRPVTLTDLDGSGRLTGDYARVVSSTGKAAREHDGGFFYTRDQDQFEQVMGYYWITRAQHYIQSLGFDNVNNRQQLLRIDQYGGDNSFYRDGTKKLTITLGKGGVDDAEDGEVIVHEYGHSVQDDQVPGFGSTPEAGAIGEAFGDYLAVTVSIAATGSTFQQPCVADWDSTSYTREDKIHCLRRVDGVKHYPEDVDEDREVHADGEIWSAALWNARTLLGDSRLADTIIIQAQFGFEADTTFKAAAETTIATAELYGGAAKNAFQKAFQDRGLLSPTLPG
jgi:hypothetical protein